jgi:hypothetical protein
MTIILDIHDHTQTSKNDVDVSIKSMTPLRRLKILTRMSNRILLEIVMKEKME